MNVFAVTYTFSGVDKVIVVERDSLNINDVKNSLHPAISSKVTDVEFVGTLA
jgi:hypothetical protein